MSCRVGRSILKQRVTVCFQTKTWGEGAGWFAQQLALGIAQAGCNVIYVAPQAVPAERDPHHDNLKRSVSNREQQSGSKPTRILSSLKRVFDGYLGCLSARRVTKTFLFSIPDPLGFFIPLQAVLALSGARQFVVVHDALPHSWVGLKQPPLLQYFALKTSYRMATHLIATTSDCRNDLVARFDIRPERIAVLPHGAFDLGQGSELPGHGNVLIFGSLRRNKRILESIKAVQLCRSRGFPARLTIAGGLDRGDPGYWADCQAQIDQAPEGIHTELGFVRDERIPELIADSDVALLPYQEFSSASGVAILMATSQRPVIATDSGGIRDLFDMGMPGVRLLRDASVADIADAIEQVLRRPIDQLRIDTAIARSTLLSALSWETIGEGYARLMFPDTDYGVEIQSRGNV